MGTPDFRHSSTKAGKIPAFFGTNPPPVHRKEEFCVIMRRRQPAFGVGACLHRSAGNLPAPGVWRARTPRVRLRLGWCGGAAPRTDVPITHWITRWWAGAINKENRYYENE